MTRFGWKVGAVVCAATAQAAIGNGFLRHVVSLALAAAILAIILAQWRVERVNAPHYTSYDEAAWFMLLSFIARDL